MPDTGRRSGPDGSYLYDLALDELDDAHATFRYEDAPAPSRDDTRLQLNRPSWEAMRRPQAVRVTIVPVSS